MASFEQNHFEERLLDQAQAQALFNLPLLGSLASLA